MSVIHFPGREPDRIRFAEAFRDFEPHIHDCVTMSPIAAHYMGNPG